MRVMVIGASRDRQKYGNRAVRAYQRQGYDVVAVNPAAASVEGAETHADVRDAAGPIDRATLYLPPMEGLRVLPQLAERGDVRELWVNPGAESPELIAKAKRLGFEPIQACSIMNIGEAP